MQKKCALLLQQNIYVATRIDIDNFLELDFVILLIN